MISGWRDQLIAHRDANPDAEVLCDTISLTNKSYTSTAASLIANFLSSTDDFQPCIASGITVADLSDIIASRMEDEGLQVLGTLSNAFQESKLVEVDLSDNAMGSKGVTACKAILGGKPVVESLERLSLCNNGLSEYTMDEVADLLTRTNGDGDVDVNVNTNANSSSSCIAANLTKLHFFNNMSGNQGCVAFKKIISRCEGKLENVRFSGTRAGPEGSAHIASALHDLARDGKLKNITRLDLADNSFGKCFEDIAIVLKQCTNLVYLNLHDCMLGDEGTKHVCNALLETNAPLTFLDLSGNEISASGAKHLAKLIKSINQSLISFSAEENEMTSIGIKRVAQALDSTTITQIVLNSNECGTIGANAIIEMAHRVPNLEKIQLDLNTFPEEVVDGLTTTFGEKLHEMEDNDDEEDADDNLDLDLDDGEESEEEEDVPEKADAEVDDLAGALGFITV